MSHDCDDTFLAERIAKTKALIVAYEDALLAFADGRQSYSLDTGQTRQSVTRVQIPSLERTLAALENRLAVLEARCGRSNAVRVIPGW